MPTTFPFRSVTSVPRVSGARVLWALLLTIVVMPFLERMAMGDVVEAGLLTLVLCTAVLAVASRRRPLLIAIALAIPAVVGRWLHHLSPGLLPPEIYLIAAVLTLGYITYLFLRTVMKAQQVNSDVLCAGVSAFFLLAMLWAFAYTLVERADPGSFIYTAGPSESRSMQGFTALYFSLVTLCTVGFGDIVPSSPVARMLAMLEGAAGIFFIAVLLSRLVSLYSSEQRAKAEGPQ